MPDLFKIWLCEAVSTGPAEEVVATEPQSEITWQRKCEREKREMDGQSQWTSQVRGKINPLTLKWHHTHTEENTRSCKLTAEATSQTNNNKSPQTTRSSSQVLKKLKLHPLQQHVCPPETGQAKTPQLTDSPPSKPVLRQTAHRPNPVLKAAHTHYLSPLL